MGIFDEGRKLTERAEDYAHEHPEQTDKVLERGEKIADERTGDRYDKQLDAAGERAERALTGQDVPEKDQQPGSPVPGSAS